MYKRSLLATMQGVEDDTDGVRISIPLQAIDNHSFSRYIESFYTVALSLSPPSGPGADDSSSTDSNQSIRSVEFIAKSTHSCQEGFHSMIKAKQKLSDADLEGAEDAYVANRKVIVDYGSLGFPQPSDSADETSPRSREQVVCDAIGIGPSSDVWSTCCMPVVRCKFMIKLMHRH